MRRIAIALLLLVVGCDVFSFPIQAPEGMDVVLGGLSNTQPYFGNYKKANFDPFQPSSDGIFLLASCGCGDWRVLFKPDDGSQQVQFPVQFYTNGEYAPTGQVTVYGEDEATSRTVRGVVDQDGGSFDGKGESSDIFQNITAQRGDAHNQPVIACGMCHIGEDSIYPLPPSHPQKYKTDPLVCLECHTVNGQ